MHIATCFSLKGHRKVVLRPSFLRLSPVVSGLCWENTSPIWAGCGSFQLNLIPLEVWCSVFGFIVCMVPYWMHCVSCSRHCCEVAESVIRRLQNTISWTDSEAECRDAVCLACSQRRSGESPRVKLQRLSSEDFRTSVRGQAVKQISEMPSALEFFATAQSFRENAHLRASTESQNSEHFHCWRQTLPLRGVLFHPAAEKELVRDVTEKRLLHRVFIATQSPNRFPQRRKLFVMSQRNVCYIVFSSRHKALVAAVSMNSPSASRLSSSHSGILS